MTTCVSLFFHQESPLGDPLGLFLPTNNHSMAAAPPLDDTSASAPVELDRWMSWASLFWHQEFPLGDSVRPSLLMILPWPATARHIIVCPARPGSVVTVTTLDHSCLGVRDLHWATLQDCPVQRVWCTGIYTGRFGSSVTPTWLDFGSTSGSGLLWATLDNLGHSSRTSLFLLGRHARASTYHNALPECIGSC